MDRPLVALVIALAAFAPPLLARAASCTPRVVVQEARCAVRTIDPVELTSALDVELGGPLSGPVEADLRVESDPCDGSATRVTAELRLLEDGRVLRRSLDLGDSPAESRPRIVALAVAEMIRAGCGPIASASASTSAPAPTASSAPIAAPITSVPPGPMVSYVPVSAPPAPSTMIAVAAESRAFAATRTGLFGGRITADQVVGPRWLHVAIDAVALRGTTPDALGDITLGLYGGGVSIGAINTNGYVLASVAARLEVAGATVSGAPTIVGGTGRSGSGSIADAAGEGRVLVRFGDHLFGTTSVLAGATLRGIRARADDRAAAGVSGAMLGVGVGLGMGLP